MLRRLFNYRKFRNIFLYGIIGGFAAILDFSTFTLLIKVFLVHNLVANIISIHIGLLCSFSLNTFLNFKKSNKLFRRFLSYYAIVLVGMGISTVILGFGALLFPILIVKLFAIAFVSIIQFFLNRFFTYRF